MSDKAGSVDPDEMAHMGSLIWMFTVFQDLSSVLSVVFVERGVKHIFDLTT